MNAPRVKAKWVGTAFQLAFGRQNAVSVSLLPKRWIIQPTEQKMA